MKRSFLFFFLIGTCFVSSQTLALGGLGSGHKTKTHNSNGIQAINAYVCSSFDCSPSDINIVAKCPSQNAHLRYGVCECDEGYVGNGTNCTVDTSCGECPEGTYCRQGVCLCSGTDKQACGLSEGAAVCCNSGEICTTSTQLSDVGVCQPKVGDCLTNSDCPENNYCSFEKSDASEKDSSFAYGHCVAFDYNETENYVYSSNPMDWWSARNWCLEHGGKMLQVESLSCSVSDMNNQGFSDHGCTGIPTELTDLVEPFHFWLADTPSWKECADKNNPENVLDVCGESDEATHTVSRYSSDDLKDYAMFFSTEYNEDLKFNGVHWLHRKHNFLAHALCQK